MRFSIPPNSNWEPPESADSDVTARCDVQLSEVESLYPIRWVHQLYLVARGQQLKYLARHGPTGREVMSGTKNEPQNLMEPRRSEEFATPGTI